MSSTTNKPTNPNDIVIVGLSEVMGRIAAYLPNSFIDKGRTIVIHTCPEYTLRASSSTSYSIIDSNFDLMLDEGVENIDALMNNKEVLGDRLHLARYISKSAQSLRLQRAGIDTPTLYLRGDRRISRPLPGFSQLAVAPSQVMLRPEYGANGRSTVRLPLRDYEDFFRVAGDPAYGTGDALRERFPQAGFTKPQDETGPYFPDGGMNEVCVTEYIPDIAAEYRLILSGDRLMSFRRQRWEDNGVIIGNGAIVREPDEINDRYPAPHRDENFLGALKAFARKEDMPMVAFDVYVREDGGMGVFEYAPGFGTGGLTAIEARQLYMDFIRDRVDEFVEARDSGWIRHTPIRIFPH